MDKIGNQNKHSSFLENNSNLNNASEEASGASLGQVKGASHPIGDLATSAIQSHWGKHLSGRDIKSLEQEVNSMLRKGKKLEREEKGDEAAQIYLAIGFSKGVKDSPRLDAALCLQELGKLEEAASIYSLMGMDEKTDVLFRLDAAGGLVGCGKLEEAASVYSLIGMDEKTKAISRFDAAGGLIECGKLEEAARVYKAMLEGDLRSNMKSKVEKALSSGMFKAQEIVGDDSQSFHSKIEAIQALEQKKPQEALRLYLLMANSKEHENLSLANRLDLADGLKRLGEVEQASRLYLSIGRKMRGGNDFLMGMAAAKELEALGHVVDAAKVYLYAMHDPLNSDENKKQAERKWQALGQTSEVADSEEIKLVLTGWDPNMASSKKLEAAETLIDMDKVDDAVKILSLVGENRDETPFNLDQVAERLLGLGRNKEAIVVYKFLAKDTRNGHFQKSAADVLVEKLGETDAAITAYVSIACNEKNGKQTRVSAFSKLKEYKAENQLNDIVRCVLTGASRNESPYARLDAASELVDKKHIKEAAEVYKSLGEDEFEKVRVNLRLEAADTLVELSKQEEGIQDYRRWALDIYKKVAFDSSNTEVHRKKALKALESLGAGGYSEMAKEVDASINEAQQEKKAQKIKAEEAFIESYKQKSSRDVLDAACDMRDKGEKKKAIELCKLLGSRTDKKDIWEVMSAADELADLGELDAAKDIYRRIKDDENQVSARRKKAEEELKRLG